MSSPFVKQLVASDRKTRDAALASLTKFLSSSREFEQIELMKLWKALFYCFWHSDRTLVQQALASDLAELVLKVSDSNFLPFLRSFWATMCREWNSIDVLRLDKFYTLLRRFAGTAFKKLYKNAWKQSLVDGYIDLLEELPLSATNQKMPNGIRYHLADIYTEELHKIVPELERTQVPIGLLIRPFEHIITNSPTKSVRVRVMKSVFEDKRLQQFGYEPILSDDEDENLTDFSAEDQASEGESESEVDEHEDGGDEEEEEEFTGFD